MPDYSIYDIEVPVGESIVVLKLQIESNLELQLIPLIGSYIYLARELRENHLPKQTHCFLEFHTFLRLVFSFLKFHLVASCFVTDV